MSKVKSIITGGLEVIRDSAKQLAGTVTPGKLIEQAIGPKTQSDEFSKYLKNLSPNISPEELEKKRKELSEADQQKLKEERKKLQAVSTTTPVHMRPPQEKDKQRPYELAFQEEERKKAMVIEAQKKQPKPITTPVSKQSRGMLGARRRPKSSDFEAGKNIKIG